MRIVPWWVWFETKQEEKEFKQLLHNSKSKFDAIDSILVKYPELTFDQAAGLVDNFQKEINKCD